MGCGVLAVVLNKEGRMLEDCVKTGLKALQHRGETSCGVSFGRMRGFGLETRKSMGLVSGSSIFNAPIVGDMAIGHTRYTTSSGANIQNAQPIELTSKSGIKYAISHNGNIANSEELRSMLRLPEGISDTVILGHLLGESLCASELNHDAIRAELDKALGSYSLAIAISGPDSKVIAIRDPLGYMPLSVGSNQDGFFVASETVAFGPKYLNAINREVKPGEMVVITNAGMSSYQLLVHKPPLVGESPLLDAWRMDILGQFCTFQAPYMMNAASKIGGQNVYVIRERIGSRIAQVHRPKVDFVVPVPDSGRSVANGYSQASGLSIREGLLKDRYEGKRGFMQDGQEKREEVINKKLNVIDAVVEGKNILVMDDSLVRGSTAKRTVYDLRAAGAREVHMAFSFPPVVSQCYYGIDFYDAQLAARPYRNMPPEELNAAIATLIDANSVYYATIEDLVYAIGQPRSQLCVACLTEKYVQDIKSQTEEFRKR
jgi:amidophosphoribosyltransferase